MEALISIHALLAESDFRWKSWSRRLSTISIHALLAESDSLSIQMTRRKTNFNPRSPCGERPSARYPRLDSNQFQSTLSLRRATRVSPTPRDTRILFQSTLSLRRATQVWQYLADGPPYFNPRSPCGERRAFPCARTAGRNFNPRSPCGERQYCTNNKYWYLPISIHALLAESDCCPC